MYEFIEFFYSMMGRFWSVLTDTIVFDIGAWGVTWGGIIIAVLTIMIACNLFWKGGQA